MMPRQTEAQQPITMQFSRLAAAVFLFLQLAAAVNVIYDETRWTKEHWNKYKVEFEPLRDFTPSEEVPSDPALKTALSGSKLNSLDGPSERRLVSRPSGCALCAWPKTWAGLGMTMLRSA